MNGHLDHLGRSLNATVGHFNQAMGSLDARVLVAARRFTELSVTDAASPGAALGGAARGGAAARDGRGSDEGPDGGRTVAV